MILKIRISKENLKKEADMIKNTASDEVYRAIKDESDLQIVKMGLANLSRNGHLLREICLHFPRRVSKLPKDLLSL